MTEGVLCYSSSQLLALLFTIFLAGSLFMAKTVQTVGQLGTVGGQCVVQLAALHIAQGMVSTRLSSRRNALKRSTRHHQEQGWNR